MSDFPRTVWITPKVKHLRDRIANDDGGPLTKPELLDLIGSHEQLRAIALVRSRRLRETEAERDRLQRLLETIAGRKR